MGMRLRESSGRTKNRGIRYSSITRMYTCPRSRRSAEAGGTGRPGNELLHVDRTWNDAQAAQRPLAADLNVASAQKERKGGGGGGEGGGGGRRGGGGGGVGRGDVKTSRWPLRVVGVVVLLVISLVVHPCPCDAVPDGCSGLLASVSASCNVMDVLLQRLSRDSTCCAAVVAANRQFCFCDEELVKSISTVFGISTSIAPKVADVCGVPADEVRIYHVSGCPDVGPTVVTGSPPATLSPPSPPLQLPTWPPPASPIGHLGNQSALRPYLSALLNKTSSLTPHPVPMIEAPSLSPQSGAGSEQGEDLVGSSLQPSFASGHDLQVGESQILLSQHSPILPGLIEGDIQGGKDSLQLSPSSSSSWGNRQDQVQVQGAAAAPSGAPTAGLEVQHGAYSNGTSAAPSGSSPEANPYGQIYYAPDLDRDNGALFNHPSVPRLFTPLLLYWTVLIRMSCDLYV